MKKISFLMITIALYSCKQQNDQTALLQQHIDSLENKIADAYKPGFGEFMSSIQVHHNKLWFAGLHQNWKLADFEMHEIMEAIENTRHYQQERKETQELDMINPALDSVNAAIQQKNPVQFKSSFILLTNTCNNCHRTVDYDFNVVKIPDNPPFSNQDFNTKQ